MIFYSGTKSSSFAIQKGNTITIETLAILRDSTKEKFGKLGGDIMIKHQ